MLEILDFFETLQSEGIKIFEMLASKNRRPRGAEALSYYSVWSAIWDECGHLLYINVPTVLKKQGLALKLSLSATILPANGH